MNRTLWICCCSLPLLILASCQVGPEERRDPVTPLPEKVKPLPYGQLLQRARNLASRANDSLYIDRWSEVEEYARGLEKTAEFLAKADDLPSKHADSIKTLSSDLGKFARQLREAAAAMNGDKATEAMNNINRKVREMRPSDGL